MPSNRTFVCVPCRQTFKQTAKCPVCKGPMVQKYKWSAPKKTNDRAWKRIAKGEWLWDRRRVRRHNDNHYSNDAWMDPTPGSKNKKRRYVSLLRTSKGPRVDMGG